MSPHLLEIQSYNLCMTIFLWPPSTSKNQRRLPCRVFGRPRSVRSSTKTRPGPRGHQCRKRIWRSLRPVPGAGFRLLHVRGELHGRNSHLQLRAHDVGWRFGRHQVRFVYILHPVQPPAVPHSSMEYVLRIEKLRSRILRAQSYQRFSLKTWIFKKYTSEFSFARFVPGHCKESCICNFCLLDSFNLNLSKSS